MLFHGGDVKAFLANRKTGRKCPCPPGKLYCFRCREARAPAEGMLDYIAISSTSGNLSAICATCEAMMHRRIRLADLAAKMPGLAVQITLASSRLSGRPTASLNCDFKR
jgi:hypothetical protein